MYIGTGIYPCCSGLVGIKPGTPDVRGRKNAQEGMRQKLRWRGLFSCFVPKVFSLDVPCQVPIRLSTNCGFPIIAKVACWLRNEEKLRFFIRVNRKILPASEPHLHARFQWCKNYSNAISGFLTLSNVLYSDDVVGVNLELVLVSSC